MTTCGSGFVQVQFYGDTKCDSTIDPIDSWTSLGFPTKIEYNTCYAVTRKEQGAEETQWYIFTGASKMGAAIFASALAVTASLY